METSAANKSYARRGSIGTLTLLGDIRIDEAETLLENARRAFTDDKATSVRLAMAEVTSLDTATIQILSALKRDVAAAGRSMEFVGISETVSDTLAQAGIAL